MENKYFFTNTADLLVILMIANIQALRFATDLVMWISLILTVVSLLDYLIKNKEVMQGTK